MNKESHQLKHCVRSYARKCMYGQCSIWSLKQLAQKDWCSLVTIEVSKDGRIVQIKTKFNQTPERKDLKLIEFWAKTNNLF